MSETDGDEGIEWLPATAGQGVRIGRRGNQLVVEWERIGRFESSSSGQDGTFCADETADGAILEKFRATSLMACRRYLAGGLSLHGSAVGFTAGAVALVGDSGAGKSTTAMALVEQHGGRFLADDVVPIDWDGFAPVVSPVNDSFWLARDASVWFGLAAPMAGKRSCPPRARAVAPEPLNAIVYLVFDDAVDGADLQAVTGRDAFLLLNGTQAGYSMGGNEGDSPQFRNSGSTRKRSTRLLSPAKATYVKMLEGSG